MFRNKKSNNIMRMPKVYMAPKDKEKKSVPRFLKFGILILIAILGLAYVLFFSAIFKIKNIAIDGSAGAETLAYLDQFKGQNIFRLQTKEIAKVVQSQNTEFKTIDVTLGIPGTLRVLFTQRMPVAVWQTGGMNYLVDENAVAFKQTDAVDPDLILISDTKNIAISPPVQIASANFMDFLKNVESKIGGLDMKITKFEINETTFQVDALTDKNVKIIFDTTRSASDQIDAAQKAYKEKKDEIKQYMDVRVEGKVYYQ